MFASQSSFEVRFEWRLTGVLEVANHSHVAIVVDVLSFSTCVEIAASRGAIVLPYRYKDESATEYAREQKARLASSRTAAGFSLSPQSLQAIEAGTRLVLPSPNGATLTLACTAPVILAGCLRNASAVAAFAQSSGFPISVIAAGERWPDDSLRFAFEDLAGAGAIIHALSGSKSAEARAAEAAFLGVCEDLSSLLEECASGRELRQAGFAGDVKVAANLNASVCVPRLVNGAFVQNDG